MLYDIEIILVYRTLGKSRGLRISTPFTQNMTNENAEEINGTCVLEEETLDKNTQDVLVIPFGPTNGESVGLLSEQKVCKLIYFCSNNENLFYIMFYLLCILYIH